MTGLGSRAIKVKCAACNGTGAIKGLNREFEVHTVTCEICKGKGTATVPRKVTHL